MAVQEAATRLPGGRWGLYRDGALVEGRGGPMVVTDKFRAVPWAEVETASAEDLDAAVAGARRALMQPLAPRRRRDILLAAAAGIAARREELARGIVKEAGKPYKDAFAEVGRAIDTFTLAAEEAPRIAGEMVPVEAAPGSEDRIAFTLRVPVGVVAAITPFNFPINLVAHKLAPALAAGNAVVLKPASATPVTALRLAQILADAGLPAGFLQVVTGGGGAIGDRLVEHPGVDLITFTGSGAIGRRITARAGLRRVCLELGNNSPVLVLADADVERAAAAISAGGFLSAGQKCISVQRVIAEAPIYERLRDLVVERVRALKTGDPDDPDTDVGPMISEAEAARAEEWVAAAVAGGARLLTGGRRRGPVLEPTLLEDVRSDMAVVCQEIFAPVVSLQRARDLDEAIATANDSVYGLQAGVFTASLASAMRCARSLEYGGVIVNDASTYRTDLMPYGGVKESGLGREGPRYAIEEMTEVRLVVMRP
jgi:acyl-CoA reductase-like NAD-dependent aldehyde dehydrogenase